MKRFGEVIILVNKVLHRMTAKMTMFSWNRKLTKETQPRERHTADRMEGVGPPLRADVEHPG